MDDDTVRLDTRLSGQIIRYHTYPTIRNQTIAEHCWNLLRIYYSVIDIPDVHMIYHMVFHDIGETITGDAPYPVKKDNPTLKSLMDSVEQTSYYNQLDFWNSFKQTMLSDADKLLFKQIELIEMAEFGMDEVCLGNSHGMIIADRCLKAVYEQEPCYQLIIYVGKRLDLFFSQLRFTITEFPKEDWWYIGHWLGKWEEKHGVKELRSSIN